MEHDTQKFKARANESSAELVRAMPSAAETRPKAKARANECSAELVRAMPRCEGGKDAQRLSAAESRPKAKARANETRTEFKIKATDEKRVNGRIRSRLPEVVSAVVCLLTLFIFFQFFYRSHLCHREQFSLFVWAVEPLRGYFLHPASLACLTGDFLTQFFSVTVVGPLLMAGVLTLLGVLTYRLLRPYIGYWTLLPAAVIVVIETGRQCGLTYPLSSTLQWVGVAVTLLICRSLGKKLWKRCRLGAVTAIMICAVAGIWLSGWGDWEKRSVNHPDLKIERMLAVDNDWYHGRLDTMEERLLAYEKKENNRLFTYYHNLLLAQTYRMGEQMLMIYQPFTTGLYLPVTPTTSYMIDYMSNEMWFLLGDMTNAEHSALLGMVFSPRSTGARPLRRLAEINLVNGDEEAAMKYLRILDKTLLYRRWARARMMGTRHPRVERWLDMKRTLIPTTDCVRSPMDPSTSFRHLLACNPDNIFARDYLLSYDLLSKNVDAFKEDYDRFVPGHHPPPRTWAEGLLVWMAAHGASEKEVLVYSIPREMIEEFMQYYDIYKRRDEHFPILQKRFGQTYWFFYHFAQGNNGEDAQ
jgi:hypothetical protein